MKELNHRHLQNHLSNLTLLQYSVEEVWVKDGQMCLFALMGHDLLVILYLERALVAQPSRASSSTPTTPTRATPTQDLPKQLCDGVPEGPGLVWFPYVLFLRDDLRLLSSPKPATTCYVECLPVLTCNASQANDDLSWPK